MTHWTKKVFNRIGYRPYTIIMIGLCALLLYGFLISEVTEETYDVQQFQLSDKTIRSAKTVEDPVKTELERDRAAAEVPISYRFHDEYAANQAALIESFFGYVLEAKEMDPADEKELDVPAMVNELRRNLQLLNSGETGLRLTDDMLRSLLAQPADKLNEMQRYMTDLITTTLEQPIREERLLAVRERIEEDIRSSNAVPSAVVAPAVALARFAIVATETINEELTAAQKEQARMSVEPTRILQGQVLVQEGQIIDKEVYRQLELAGLTEQEGDYKPLIGLLLFVLIAAGLLFIIVDRSSQKEADKRSSLLVVLSVLVLILAIMKGINSVEDSFDVMIAFLFPTALGGMITRLLTGERMAVYITAVAAGCGGIILQESYAATLQMDVALYILLGGLTGVFLTGQEDRGSRLIQKSLVVSAVNMLFVGFYLLSGQSQHSLMEIGYYCSAAFVSGLLSGALTVGLLPLFESAFGLLSTLRLVELSNPNHPLLRKILTETPGTYHHSVMVANLSEAACEEIGANGLLARVASYYHDIGKTKQPPFFIENQVNMSNPHDSLPPEKSRDIILAHTVEGAETLRSYKMPAEIVAIAAEHHGTSLLKFFFYKAKEQDPDTKEAAYRYVGPKPQTKEAAVISLADSVEAAVRSMKEPTAEKIEKLVAAIVEDKVKDGQLDECDLTMKDLKTIKRVLCETLNGFFHSRIEYPKEQQDRRDERDPYRSA